MIWKPHFTVATVVEDQGRFLIVEELIEGRLVHNQPAGHLEDREGVPEAAVRETLEETAWEVEPQFLIGLYQWRHPDNERTFIRATFAARPLRHHPHRGLDEEIQRVRWLTRAELAQEPDKLRSPMVLGCIDDYLAGRRFPLELLVRL